MSDRPAAESASVTTELPRPGTSRWQPLRLGLVDLFYYDDEQFWFHDGRLLLRGNNGTGKSKVLALTLPFLLDGSVLSRRVEPDADPKKRMEWNLLLDGAHPHTERTGYAWVEFGRIDAAGAEEFCTLGAGLKAAAGRGLVNSPWYFITERRIGDLRLLDENRIVVTQSRLRDELEGTGTGRVYDQQGKYRRAVDEALFRLGEERYTALIDLLIQLRQPQLSKRPDEGALSAALTEALKPLDQAVIADAAESFRSLEEERTGIAAAKATLGAAEGFLQHYRAYARVATRRHTSAVRLANSAFEHAGRDLTGAQDALAAAVEEADRLTTAHGEAQERQAALEGQEHALRESPEMRDAHRLDQAAQAAQDLHSRVEQLSTEELDAADRADRDQAARETAEQRRECAEAEADRDRAEAARLARPAGLAGDHETIACDAQAAGRALNRRRDQIGHVARLLDQRQQAESDARAKRTALDTAEADSTARLEAEHEAKETFTAQAGEYRTAVRSHAAGLTELTLPCRVEELADLAQEWAHTPDGPSPVPALLDRAVAGVQTGIEGERADARQQAKQLAAALAETDEEIASLRAGRDPEPPPVPGREPEVRTGSPGAPLWRVVDFTASVPEDSRAGVEAALQSGGLLDAWIFPDGTVSVDGDVVLGPSGAVAAAPLSASLVPAVGPEDERRGLTGEAVAAVLHRIGLGAGSADLWVGADGSWGAGPVRGAWAKESAEFIGAGARERYRLSLIATLTDRREQLQEQLDQQRHRQERAEARLSRIRDERADYPEQAERLVISAQHALEAAARELANARERVQDAERIWTSAAEVAEHAAAELTDQAEELGLGRTAADLDEARDAVRAYEVILVQVRAAVGLAQDAVTAMQEAQVRAEESAGLLKQRRNELQDLRTRAATAQATFEALRATVGASVDELQQRLARIADDKRDVAEQLSSVMDRRLGAEGEKSRLGQQVEDLGHRREERAEERGERIEELRTFADTGLLRVALPELPAPDPAIPQEWSITTALTLSRAAEQELSAADESDRAWTRVQQRVSNAATELSTQMSRHGHTSFVEQRGDVLVARVRFHGEEIDIDRMAERLAADVADRERLLSAREREILENHLVNEVAGHLHELLLAAEGQIDRMNRELAVRKTSTGMQLRVTWRERGDGPAGLTAARRLLGRSDATWTAEDRAAIGDFLQARIGEVREGDPTGSWQEHLERALDYRQWHRFGVERWQAGQWRSASGPASGGEKVLSVSIPLFAAASAHYNSADPSAPRLILLDEAFAGVDDDSRAKSLGLLATFDLDVVMTSEREWGCYPQVPGLAIAQLSRVEGIEAIGVSRWRWDGRRRERMAELSPANGDDTQPGGSPEPDGLFA